MRPLTAVNQIFRGPLHVHYGQAYLICDDKLGELSLDEAFRGQTNGLCGGAVAGQLFLLTGLHTGEVGFSLEVHDFDPGVDDTWQEIVEVSFQAPGSEDGEFALHEWGGEQICRVPLAPGATYRVRYCASGMDRGACADTHVRKDPVDFYHLIFWPGPSAADAVLKETSANAAYWHRFAQGLTL